MKILLYQYPKCSTCQKAIKFLKEEKIEVETKDIVTTPPHPIEIEKMLLHLKARKLDFKKLFNASGLLYKEMNLSEKIKNGLSEKEALVLLSKHGKLIKRPFLLSADFGLLGFNEAEWSEVLKQV